MYFLLLTHFTVTYDDHVTVTTSRCCVYCDGHLLNCNCIMCTVSN